MELKSNSRKVQYLVTLAVSLAAITAGFSVFWTTPMIPKFHDNETDIVITENEISWMAALSSPGFMAGSLASRFVADKFGRRATILGSALPIASGTIIILSAPEAWMLYLTRFLWGCGTGMIVTVSAIYIVEIADKDVRGALSVGNRNLFNFGSFLVMSVGPFVYYQVLDYMLLALPIGFFIACWWVPETPYYHLKEGKIDAARRELLLLKGFKDEKVLEQQLSQMQSNVMKEMRHSGTTKELFTGKQYRKAIIIAVGLKITQITSGSLVIQQYLGRIMQESKSAIKVSTALITFGAVRFVVGLISSVLVEKVGRRPLLIYSYFGTSLALAVVGTYFFFEEVINITTAALNPFRYITFVGIIFSIIISTIGFDSLIYVIPAEIFPINVKSVAMTSFNILGGCLNFTVVKLYQEARDLVGLCGVFWFFAGCSLLGAIFSYFVVPETKGKTLRQIQIELQGDIYDDTDDNLIQTAAANGVNEITELKDLKSSDQN